MSAVLLLLCLTPTTGVHAREVAGKSDHGWSNAPSREHGLPNRINDGRYADVFANRLAEITTGTVNALSCLAMR